MRLILLFAFTTTTAFGQVKCTDFFTILGQREISEKFQNYLKACGPFEENKTIDGLTKTITSDEKGIQIMLINRATDKTESAKFEVLSIELKSFTDKGGYKDELPFGFTMGMDHKLVKAHIETLENVEFDKKDLTKKSSSFTYSGSRHSGFFGKKAKVYVTQYDGKSITSMRMRVK